MMKVELYGNLKDVVEDLISLRESGFDAYCEFNGHTLHSKNVTLDSAYLEVTGFTYSEFLKKRQEEMQKWEEEQQREKDNAKAKTPEWIARGHKYIPEELWTKWEECIEIRIRDLYNGMEVEAALVVMEAHAEGKSIEEIVNIIDSQGHSGASYGMLRSIITFFYPAGKELFEQIAEFENNNKKLS